MNRRTTPAPPKFKSTACPLPPPGYAPCTRLDGHDGPCAMPFAPTIIGEAEALFINVKAVSMQIGEYHGLTALYPDYMILPWRLYWGWILGGYPRAGSFSNTRVRLNIFSLVPRIHWLYEV